MRCPVTIPCGHIFCRKCILQWLKRQQTCPCCRTEVRGKMLVLMHKVKRKINHLQVKCPYEYNGCPAQFPLFRLEEHAESCAFELLSCSNEDCQALILRKDMYNHSQSCEHWKELCSMGCGTLLVPANRDDHNCYMVLKEDYTRQVQKLRQKARRMEHISSQIRRQIQLITDTLQSAEPAISTSEME
ncbi:RING finger protein 151 [Bombina bombina]|uniref:RING finger protein 151 n=1 Tax=Bombina bombina TaxID=8345 RepID=UPI00235B166C|nr:RING finger protein 151 [Bombina bombina]